jgi:hypothetical protein
VLPLLLSAGAQFVCTCVIPAFDPPAVNWSASKNVPTPVELILAIPLVIPPGAEGAVVYPK